MAEISGIYDNGPIAPVAKIDEKLTIWTENSWQPFNIDYIEGIPRSRPMVIDLVTLNNAANIPALGTLNAQFVLAIQPAGGNTNKANGKVELLHLRWEPIGMVEGMLFELTPARYNPRGAQATVTPFTALRDPYLATTTFFVLGPNKDARIGAYNPLAAVQPAALFVFWGFRYVLTTLGDQKPAISTKIPAQAFAF